MRFVAFLLSYLPISIFFAALGLRFFYHLTGDIQALLIGTHGFWVQIYIFVAGVATGLLGLFFTRNKHQRIACSIGLACNLAVVLLPLVITIMVAAHS
jgi:hypothetical protein